MRILFFTQLLILGCFLYSPSYAQESDSTYVKMKEYNKMLEEGLITKEDYDKLKERLLFGEPDTAKVAMQTPLIINMRKQITKTEYDSLRSEYTYRAKSGRRILGMSIFLDLASIGFYVGAAKSGEPGFAYSGIALNVIAFPMFIAGIVKTAKYNNKVNNLATDYQIIARE